MNSFINLKSFHMKKIGILIGFVFSTLILLFIMLNVNEGFQTKNNDIVLYNDSVSKKKDKDSISNNFSNGSNEILDDVNFEKVVKWIDGTQMNDGRVDNIIYFKKGDVFFKRKFSGPVTANFFNAKGDGLTDDTEALQSMLSSDYPEIALEEGKTYLVRKNTNLTGFPNSDQPCLLIIGKSKFALHGNGATIVVKEHAQGILEVQKSKDVIIRNLHVVGAGNFPKIDGNTGYSEKGIAGKGYHSSGFWGFHKNNSKNTTKEHRGGFNGRFPQFNSNTTSTTWGGWNGGYIGNVSYGILIHNACNNITIENCSAKKFNYVGIGVGHNGDLKPNDLNYLENKNITFRRCFSSGNFSAGFHSMDVNGFNLIDSKSIENGHPMASPAYETCDPGYGYTARGSYKYTVNGIVSNSEFRGNKRKGLDVHAGKGIIFRNNTIYNSNVCGIFAAWSSDSQPAMDISILNNQIIGCGKSKNSLGSVYLGANGKSKEENRVLNSKIIGNSISEYSGSAIRVRYGNSVNIKDNKIQNSVKGNSPNLSAILILGQKSTNNEVHSIDIFNNSILDSKGYMKRGIQLSYTKDVNVEGNTINFNKDVDNAIIVREGKNIFIEKNNIKLLGKGNVQSIPKNAISNTRNLNFK